jgi:hypothetical protein
MLPTYAICSFFQVVLPWGMTALAPASQEIAPSQPPAQKRKFGGPHPIANDGRRHRRPKIMLVTRDSLDRRSLASKTFDALVEQVTSDLGNDLSTIETRMVESFAGISVMIDNLNTQMLLGKDIDVALLCQLASTLMRIGGRLGLKRRAKDATTTDLRQYLDAKCEESPDDQG